MPSRHQLGIGDFDGDGVFLIGREAAGSARGRDALLLRTSSISWSSTRRTRSSLASTSASTSSAAIPRRTPRRRGRLGGCARSSLARPTPCSLLTATPIQNSLAELWGLVQYVDPLGTLLGDLRDLPRGVLRSRRSAAARVRAGGRAACRLRSVLQRTLRRQAQDFLEKPFVERAARLFEYPMAPDE